MRTTKTKCAFVLLSLVVALPLPSGGAKSEPSVVVVPNIGDLANIDRAVFSPDGRLVATWISFPLSNVKLWDIDSGRLLRTLEYEAYFDAIAFSPDGKWIASAHKDGKIKLWDLTTGASPMTLQGRPRSAPDANGGMVRSLCFDAKSELLISGNNAGQIMVWSVTERKELRRFAFGNRQDRERIIGIRLTADQESVVAVTRESVKVFDLKIGKVTAAFDLSSKHDYSIRDGKYVFDEDSIVSDDGLVVRYQAIGCQDELLFLTLKDTKNLVSVDKPAACTSDNSDAHGNPTIFTSSKQSRLIIARAGSPELKEWDPKSRAVTGTIRWPNEASAKIIGVDRDFRLAMSQEGDKVRVRELQTGAPVRNLIGYEYSAENVIASKDGRHMLVSHHPSLNEPKQKDIWLWQVDALQPKMVHLAADNETIVYDFSSAAKIAIASNDSAEIIIFSTETGNEIRRFSVAGISFVSSRSRIAPDGKLIALIGSDADKNAVAVLVRANDGTVIRRFDGYDERNGVMASSGRDDLSNLVTAVAFSPDRGNVAIGRWDGTAEVWSTKEFRRISVLPAAENNEADQIWSLAFSKDGNRLVGGSRDRGVFLWDVAKQRLLKTFQRGTDSLAGHFHIASVAISDDGKLVVGGLSPHSFSSGDFGADYSVEVWAAATGKHRFTLRGHDGGVGALAFSSNGRWIISASDDGTIKYWNRKTGKSIATFAAGQDGRWIFITEPGLFSGSAESDEFVNVVRGVKVLPVSKFRDQLFRSGLVESLLKGDPGRRYEHAVKKLNLEKIWDSLSSQ